VIHLEDDDRFRKPANASEPLTFDPKEQRKGAQVFKVVDSEKRRGPEESHRHNLPGFAER
jgi:hypothetical protein